MSFYTYRDIAGCLVAALGFALLAGPGYVVGWVTDLLGFRGRSLGERLTWSVPLSFGVVTLLAVMAGKYVSLNVACWVVVWLGVTAVALVGIELIRGRRFRLGRTGRLVVAAGLGGAVFVVGELVDVGLGNKLYMNVAVYDHALRTAFVDAVVRTGVPPGNPLYWTVSDGGVGHAAPMRYYYFWYVVCAVVVKVAGVSARQAMIASCAWSGFGLAAAIGLYGRYFLTPAKDVARARRRIWITVGLLVVTGLDLIPAIVAYLQGMDTDPDMEWWSAGQVTSWMDTMLWVPHHLAALVCCVFGFLLIWMSEGRGGRQRVLCGVIAGVGFAASFGLSTYVAVAFAMVMAGWLVWAWVRRDGRDRCAVLLGSGLVAVVLLAPYLRELRAAGPNAGGRTAVFALAVRPMIDPISVAKLPGFKQMRTRSVGVEEQVAALVLMAPGYAAELGFFAAVLVVVLLRRWKSLGDGEQTAVFLVVAGLVVSSLVKSTVIGTNDFGIRSMLIPQFFLLLLAGLLLDGTIRAPRRSVRVVLAILMVVGMGGTVYQAVLLRLYLPVQDRLQRKGLGGLAERNMALREIRRDLDGRSPKMAVVQYDTHQPSDFFNFAQLLNTPRQTANAAPECNVAFGGDPGPCEGIKAELARLYLGAAEDADEARATCHRLGIDELVATQWDPVWRVKDGWVWTLPVVAETERARVLACGTTTR
ncbi:hypothetical protein [Granulicella sp. dw_53]|uniref:hypothetical protein n=1 Tax=Granulicella sp. dw_53 TaxID=2719792 RepID=UPI001BD642E9|nr:hypothetical protein [Granulicella sp. dw_53]